jgi:2-amino-4-hydroxy-6-hydroxymethyldihydropteridine diphosphokinase
VSGAVRRAFVALGSNLGDRGAYLAQACDALSALPGTSLLGASSVYETAPRDRADQPAFLNQVVALETALEPRDLLTVCQRIETDHGRRRDVRFGPRTLDIDILLIEGMESDDPLLTLPHPRMWQRAFVLVPLAEVWSFARGMPAVDVPALGSELARRQPVQRYVPPEDRG